MGTYCYAIKSPKHVVSVQLSGGQTMDAAIATYSHKPTSDGFWGRPKAQWERLANAKCAAMDARWAEREMPPLMIKINSRVDKVQVEDWAYVCKRGSFYDGGEVPVGKVVAINEVKQGRKTLRIINVQITHPENLPVITTPELEHA